MKDDNNAGSSIEHSSPSKRLCFTPLADASNQIMAQAAFLSALAGTKVPEAAAQTAVTAVSHTGQGESKANIRIIHKGTQDSSITHNGNSVLKSSSQEGHSYVNPMQKEKLKVDEEFCRGAVVQVSSTAVVFIPSQAISHTGKLR